jgi:hypothetical protein
VEDKRSNGFLRLKSRWWRSYPDCDKQLFALTGKQPNAKTVAVTPKGDLRLHLCFFNKTLADG